MKSYVVYDKVKLGREMKLSEEIFKGEYLSG